MRVPDYNDLLKTHETKQEAMLERLPICSCCKEPIQDEWLYDFNGELYCERCMDDFKHLTEYYER